MMKILTLFFDKDSLITEAFLANDCILGESEPDEAYNEG
jgi:hypothetical protein